MNTITSNPRPQASFGVPNRTDQESGNDDYRRRDVRSTLLPEDLGENFQTRDRNSHLDDQADSFSSETDREILDPEESGEKISDPNGRPDTEFPQPEDDKEINPNRPVPEDDNYIDDEDGAVIKEPTREIDDPYRPGHDKPESDPSIDEEFPDPKENTETIF